MYSPHVWQYAEAMKKVYFTREKEDQNWWNFILSVFFLIILVWAMWEIWGEQGSFPHTIPVFDALLMALAAFRITRLLVYDKITRWFRELFVQKRLIEVDGVELVELTQYESGIRRTLSDLLACPWCIGFWSAIIIVFLYYMYPWAWVIILFLAIAGASSFVQLTANAIGWKAEQLKLDVHERESLS